MTNECPYCQSDDIEEGYSQEPIPHHGKQIFVNHAYCYCVACEGEFETPEQQRYNRYEISDAKRIVDGLLSAKEIEDARRQLGLTQAQAAKTFGGGRRAFSKYERGEVIQSLAMDRLIRVCLRHPELLKELNER